MHTQASAEGGTHHFRSTRATIWISTILATRRGGIGRTLHPDERLTRKMLSRLCLCLELTGTLSNYMMLLSLMLDEMIKIPFPLTGLRL